MKKDCVARTRMRLRVFFGGGGVQKKSLGDVAPRGFGGKFSIWGPKSYVCFLIPFFDTFLTFFDLFFNPSTNPTLSVWEKKSFFGPPRKMILWPNV